MIVYPPGPAQRGIAPTSSGSRGGNRTMRYRSALGSAKETWACIDVAIALGYVESVVTLGRSGLRVSPFCLGTMTFGDDFGWGSSVEVSTQIIDSYLEKGGNFIDTANLYTKGHSEVIIGDHLAKTPGKRDRLVLATKFSGNHFPERS